jgi:hypothetical protein
MQRHIHRITNPPNPCRKQLCPVQILDSAKPDGPANCVDEDGCDSGVGGGFIGGYGGLLGYVGGNVDVGGELESWRVRPARKHLRRPRRSIRRRAKRTVKRSFMRPYAPEDRREVEEPWRPAYWNICTHVCKRIFWNAWVVGRVSWGE